MGGCVSSCKKDGSNPPIYRLHFVLQGFRINLRDEKDCTKDLQVVITSEEVAQHANLTFDQLNGDFCSNSEVSFLLSVPGIMRSRNAELFKGLDVNVVVMDANKNILGKTDISLSNLIYQRRVCSRVAKSLVLQNGSDVQGTFECQCGIDFLDNWCVKFNYIRVTCAQGSMVNDEGYMGVPPINGNGGTLPGQEDDICYVNYSLGSLDPSEQQQSKRKEILSSTPVTPKQIFSVGILRWNAHHLQPVQYTGTFKHLLEKSLKLQLSRTKGEFDSQGGIGECHISLDHLFAISRIGDGGCRTTSFSQALYLNGNRIGNMDCEACFLNEPILQPMRNGVLRDSNLEHCVPEDFLPEWMDVSEHDFVEHQKSMYTALNTMVGMNVSSAQWLNGARSLQNQLLQSTSLFLSENFRKRRAKPMITCKLLLWIWNFLLDSFSSLSFDECMISMELFCIIAVRQELLRLVIPTKDIEHNRLSAMYHSALARSVRLACHRLTLKGLEDELPFQLTILSIGCLRVPELGNIVFKIMMDSQKDSLTPHEFLNLSHYRGMPRGYVDALKQFVKFDESDNPPSTPENTANNDNPNTNTNTNDNTDNANDKTNDNNNNSKSNKVDEISEAIQTTTTGTTDLSKNVPSNECEKKYENEEQVDGSNSPSEERVTSSSSSSASPLADKIEIPNEWKLEDYRYGDDMVEIDVVIPTTNISTSSTRKHSRSSSNLSSLDCASLFEWEASDIECEEILCTTLSDRFEEILPVDCVINSLQSVVYSEDVVDRFLAQFLNTVLQCIQPSLGSKYKSVDWQSVPYYRVICALMIVRLRAKPANILCKDIAKAGCLLVTNNHAFNAMFQGCLSHVNAFDPEQVAAGLDLVTQWIKIQQRPETLYPPFCNPIASCLSHHVVSLTMDVGFLIRSVEVMLDTKLSQVISKCLEFLYNVWDMLHGSATQRITQCLMVHFWDLFLHWSDMGVRRFFIHLLVFRVTQPRYWTSIEIRDKDPPSRGTTRRLHALIRQARSQGTQSDMKFLMNAKLNEGLSSLPESAGEFKTGALYFNTSAEAPASSSSNHQNNKHFRKRRSRSMHVESGNAISMKENGRNGDCDNNSKSSKWRASKQQKSFRSKRKSLEGLSSITHGDVDERDKLILGDQFNIPSHLLVYASHAVRQYDSVKFLLNQLKQKAVENTRSIELPQLNWLMAMEVDGGLR